MGIRIAIFASGSGTNAENIINYFQPSQDVSIPLILTNNPSAGVIKRAEKLGINYRVFSRDDFFTNDRVEQILAAEKIDYIILAGFLWLVPVNLIKYYKGRIINIHPALLPAFGGKGFYGDRVHDAVIESGQPISGISIHHVTEKFDDGGIIFQAACHVDRSDDASSLSDKIHLLEHKYFPVVLEKLFKEYMLIR